MQASLAYPQSLDDQRTIVEQVFATMVGIALVPCELHVTQIPPPIAAMLSFTEASEGVIVVECSPRLAFLFTERLMSIPPPSSLDPDVADAMGELANMIGGNLKGLMPDETRVSIPRVLRAEELEELLRTSHRMSRVCFSAGSEGQEHCCVSLFEHLSD